MVRVHRGSPKEQAFQELRLEGLFYAIMAAELRSKLTMLRSLGAKVECNYQQMKIQLESITIHVELKNIKNIHLRVYPPDGRVGISAPWRTDLGKIRSFASSKLGWIKNQQEKIRNYCQTAPSEYCTGEIHSCWGQKYRLQVIEGDGSPQATLAGDVLELHVRPGTIAEKRREILDAWYRTELKKAIPPLIASWEKQLGVTVAEFGIKKMKTKWGTCNYGARRIWLNLELAKKPPSCLEYIVVHEMAHLLEPNHGKRFKALLDYHLPRWRLIKEELKQL